MMKLEINLENFSELRSKALQKREDKERQGEALSDILLLRSFALENDMQDEAVELYFEEALIHQHNYMETKAVSELAKMRDTINEVKKYVQDRELLRWESRVARYLGRVADYEGKFDEAIKYYQEAIEKAELDPKYSTNKALSYEYRGFLIVDELRTKDLNETVNRAEELYFDYDKTAEGFELKQKDYTTWAIWRSAVLINLCSGVIDLGKLSDFKEKIEEWLDLAESNFVVPEGVKVWSDFGFRKNEIKRIREKINDKG